jgi:hypothetical protein
MTTRTSRRRLHIVPVAALAVAVGASVVAAMPASATSTAASSAAPAAASATPSSAARAAMPAAAGSTGAPLKLLPPPAFKPTLVRPVVYDNCPTVRAHATQDPQGSRLATCITVTRDPAPAPANPSAAAQSPVHAGTQAIRPAAVPALCANQFGVWVIDRTTQCIQGLTITTKTFINKLLVGTGAFRVDQSIVLNTYNNFFTENDTITRTDAMGVDGADAVAVSFTPSCTSPCQPGSGGGTTSFTLALPNTPGAQRSLAYSFLDNPAVGTQNRALTSYTWIFKLVDPAVPPPAAVSYSAGEAARCDNQLPGKGPGCVYPTYGPILTLPISTFGAAAINVLVGEKDLAGTPGLTAATPLTRGNPADTSENRAAICDGTFFRNLLLVANDSCDEYPFASSQQSGGQQNLTGKDCAEIVPLMNSSGGWNLWEVTQPPAPAQRCLRGHVPGPQNSAVGTALLQMYTFYRMLAGDPYLVNVTA